MPYINLGHVPDEQANRWRECAEADERPLAQWIRRAADAAAKRVEAESDGDRE